MTKLEKYYLTAEAEKWGERIPAWKQVGAYATIAEDGTLAVVIPQQEFKLSTLLNEMRSATGRVWVDEQEQGWWQIGEQSNHIEYAPMLDQIMPA